METNKIWRTIYEESSSFQKATVLHNMFDSTFLSERDIKLFLADLQKCALKELDLRTYIDGGLHYNYVSKIQQQTVSNDVSLESCCNEIFDCNKYGLIINSAEKISDRLTSKFTSFSNFLNQTSDPLVVSLDLVLFIGNYGYTPFGIHNDGYNQNVIHFHIGPNPKTMYVWDTELYFEHGGMESNNFAIREMLPYAEKYELLPNSIFFLPRNHFHIGHTEDFSIGCSIGLFQSNTRDLLMKSFEYSLTNTLSQDKKEVINDTGLIASQINLSNAPRNIKDTYVDFVDDYLQALKSNCLFENVPSKKKNYTIAYSDMVALRKEYTILSKTKGDKLIVYIRKKRVSFPNISPVADLINRLNSRKPFKLSQLVNSYSAATIELLKKMIEFMNMHRALKLSK